MEKKIVWITLPCKHTAEETNALEVTCPICRSKFQRVAVTERWNLCPRPVDQPQRVRLS